MKSPPCFDPRWLHLPIAFGAFSFVLARVGLSTDSIGGDLYALVLTTAILTMVLTSFVSGQTARVYALKRRWFRQEALESSNMPDDLIAIIGSERARQTFCLMASAAGCNEP